MSDPSLPSLTCSAEPAALNTRLLMRTSTCYVRALRCGCADWLACTRRDVEAEDPTARVEAPMQPSACNVRALRCGCADGLAWAQGDDEAEDLDARSESGEGSGFVVPDDHLSGDEGLHNAQADLDGLQADLRGALPAPACSQPAPDADATAGQARHALLACSPARQGAADAALPPCRRGKLCAAPWHSQPGRRGSDCSLEGACGSGMPAASAACASYQLASVASCLALAVPWRAKTQLAMQAASAGVVQLLAGRGGTPSTQLCQLRMPGAMQVLEAALAKARSSSRLLIASRLRQPAAQAQGAEAAAQTRHLVGDPALLDTLCMQACPEARWPAAGVLCAVGAQAVRLASAGLSSTSVGRAGPAADPTGCSHLQGIPRVGLYAGGGHPHQLRSACGCRLAPGGPSAGAQHCCSQVLHPCP